MLKPPASEFPWIEYMLRHAVGSPHRLLTIPPGDDCAEIKLPDEQGLGSPAQNKFLFAADMLMDQVHFDSSVTDPFLIGGKAVKVNLSDIAAMAGLPLTITVSLALPKTGGAALGQAVMSGVAAVAREFDVAVAGGDTNSWHGPLVISVSVVGLVHPKGSVTRSRARPGDFLFVTGPLGGSLPFDRHLTFTPKVALAKWLHDQYGLSSMLDLSDGLASDLRHILRQSAVGAVLDRSSIPIHGDVHRALANDLGGYRSSGLTPLDHALCDGEDFELCLSVDQRTGERLLSDIARLKAGSGVPAGWDRLGAKDQNSFSKLTKIGFIKPQTEGLTWQDGSPFESTGYSHLLEAQPAQR